MRHIFFLLLLPLSLQAGGVILYEIGSNDVGLASAGWAARAEDPSTAFTNPAGMTRLCSRQLQIGLQPIYGHLVFDPDAETNVRGKKGRSNEWIPAGGIYYVHPINDCWTAGVSTLGYFGSKLKFNHDWVGRYYLTEIILQGFSFVPSVAFKLTDKLSVGVGANVMFAIFDQKSAVNNSIDHLPDGKLKLYDNDFGFGLVAGVLYELTPCTRLGLQYVSKVRLQFRDTPRFEDLGPTLESLLSVSGLLKSQVLLDVNVPQCLMFSAYQDLTDWLAIMGNVGWQEWSNFQKATIALGSPTDASLTFIPKYKDTWHAAIGAKVNYSDSLSLFGGFAYDSSAISAKNRPLDFPVGKQWRYGTGFQWSYSEDIILGICYEFMWQGDLNVDVNKGSLAGHVSGDYNRTFAHFIDLNIQWAF